MDSLHEQYGYDDVLFVSETPEYMRCVFCSLVLRDPVQILTCGHKFCSPCFDRMKKYAENNNKQFSCPIDREAVDMAMVHKDVAMKRVIGNLNVHCETNEDGCPWVGDFSELGNHTKKCPYQQQNSVCLGGDTTEYSSIIRDLSGRVSRCESLLALKDKEMAGKDQEKADLRLMICELSKELRAANQERSAEIAILKQEMKELKDTSGFLLSENKALENQAISLSAQVNALTLGNSPQKVAIPSESKCEFELWRGNIGDIALSSESGNCRVSFRNFSTASMPNVFVGNGARVYYEVGFLIGIRNPNQAVQVGWASYSFDKLTSDNVNYVVPIGVGDVHSSYSFDPIDGNLLCEGEHENWNEVFDDDQSDKCLGVALDMVEGTISFSINGTLAHKVTGLDGYTGFFPAITGSHVTIEVNIGHRPFVYGRPDDSYQTLIEEFETM